MGVRQNEAGSEFDRFLATDPAILTDIQRAVRFYYLLRTSFDAQIAKPRFSAGPWRASHFNLIRIEDDLLAARERLNRVTIENRPYAEIIQRYDRPDTFFYLDPPYYGCETYYGKGIFTREDFNQLADLLATLKGTFILSLNDTPDVRRIFGRFSIRTITTRYRFGNANRAEPIRELLIQNYESEARVAA